MESPICKNEPKTVEINCDALWSKAPLCLGLGVVVRDAFGKLIIGKTAKGTTASSLEAEAKCALLAMELAVQNNLSKGMVLLTLSVSIIPPQSGRVVFFVALYILSVAEGGQKPCVQTFAADQFDENTPEEIKVKSSFFNWWYLGVVFGATSATLGVVYLQDNIGWGLGFGILAGVLVVSLVSFLLGTKRYRKQMPPGSPFTMVVQVLVAAARKWHVNKALNSECVYYGDEGEALLQGQSQPLVVARANQLRYKLNIA
ncbi:hypothetical protein FF2_039407 [Malus domestica]